MKNGQHLITAAIFWLGGFVIGNDSCSNFVHHMS